MIRASQHKVIRSAFTLIELMVVIAIIALLVALSAGAVMRYLTTQKGNVTETTIAAVDSESKKHWQKVIDQAARESVPLLQGGTVDGQYGCNGDANLARVIYIKLKLMQQFPMSFNEVFNTTNPNTLPPDIGYQRYLTQYGYGGSTAATQPFESSACLLMALERDRGGMKLNTDLLKSSVKTLPSGLPFLADGWDQPLAFYRWPTANDEVNALNKAQPNSVAAIKRDSQDPDGKLMDPTWQSVGGATFVNNIHGLSASGSRYLVPVIASAGPNKKLGIDVWPLGAPDPMSIGAPTAAVPGNANDEFDNLYNFRLSLGGKGN
jgi:prepilin-type N-terminal cleavage/methylation domain-containing protein